MKGRLDDPPDHYASQKRARVIKRAVATRGKEIGQLIDESLDFFASGKFARQPNLFAQAKAANGLNELQAIKLVLDEVQHARQLQ